MKIYEEVERGQTEMWSRQVLSCEDMTKDLTVSDKCWYTTIKHSAVKIMTKDLTVSNKCWHTTIKHSALVLTKTKTSQNNMVK